MFAVASLSSGTGTAYRWPLPRQSRWDAILRAGSLGGSAIEAEGHERKSRCGVSAAVRCHSSADRNLGALLNEHSELDTAELRRLRMAAREARAMVDLMAPDSVRSLAKSAQTDREIFGTVHLELDESMDPAKAKAAWTRVREGTVSLREAMRTDLGLQGLIDDNRQQAGE